MHMAINDQISARKPQQSIIQRIGIFRILKEIDFNTDQIHVLKPVDLGRT